MRITLIFTPFRHHPIISTLLLCPLFFYLASGLFLFHLSDDLYKQTRARYGSQLSAARFSSHEAAKEAYLNMRYQSQWFAPTNRQVLADHLTVFFPGDEGYPEVLNGDIYVAFTPTKWPLRALTYIPYKQRRPYGVYTVEKTLLLSSNRFLCLWYLIIVDWGLIHLM